MRRPRKRWQLPRRCRCPRTGHALAARPRPSCSRAGAWAERADTPGQLPQARRVHRSQRVTYFARVTAPSGAVLFLLVKPVKPCHEMLDGLDREPDSVAGEVIAEEIQTPLSHWSTGPRCVREFAHRDVFVSMLES